MAYELTDPIVDQLIKRADIQKAFPALKTLALKLQQAAVKKTKTRCCGRKKARINKSVYDSARTAIGEFTNAQKLSLKKMLGVDRVLVTFVDRAGRTRKQFFS